MDIERLTKAQIVLLTLLVSFVTSIATGIVTVTLLDQAPPVITQTINRVVEKTVERVVPGENQAATVITNEKTIVVNEEDLITDAIKKNTDKIVRIYRDTSEGRVYLGAGVIVSKDGVVTAATDASLVRGGDTFRVVLSNGKDIPGTLAVLSDDKPTALVRLTFTEVDGVVPGSIKYGDLNTLKLGQSVITLSGTERLSVAAGIISGLDEKETKVAPLGNASGTTTPATVSVLEAIETTIGAPHIEKGGILINLFGDVVGISTVESRIRGQSYFTPIQVVQSQIVELAARK
ncbi:serine protease [Candidatus Kaiserbacteria bacterium]|nr:serine protease [Candidatus Kaiserbacteria bacterium]